MLFAFAGFALSTGCVLYYEIVGKEPPDPLMYLIAPGIWVGGQVYQMFGEAMYMPYIAGIMTMTILSGTLGAGLEAITGDRRSTS